MPARGFAIVLIPVRRMKPTMSRAVKARAVAEMALAFNMYSFHCFVL
jgi:hypothetical protein